MGETRAEPPRRAGTEGRLKGAQAGTGGSEQRGAQWTELGNGVTVLLQRPMQNIGGLGAWQPQKTQKDSRFLWETREVCFTGGRVGAVRLEQKEPGHGGQAHLSSKSTVVGSG